MISLAITTYNRSGLTVESFINVIDNDYVDEIVIVDDCSDMVIFNNLKKLIMRMGHVKVKLYRNKKNLGVFLNKIEAVKKCKNEWVILFDSDNVIDNDYIGAIRSIERDEDVLFCPENLWNVNRSNIQWSYREFSDIYVDRHNISQYVENINFEIHLNTGNNFFNKSRFLSTAELIEDPVADLVSSDSSYISYLWLLNGGRTKIVSNLGYGHRVHDGSNYSQHIAEGLSMNAKIYQKMRELNPPKGGFPVSKDFKDMIVSSYGYNEQVFNTDPKWAILGELYTKNFLNAPDYWRGAIPKRIHQIWLGGQIPEKYRVLTETWKACNPGWTYKLWTDADVATMDIPNRELFDSLTNYGPKSDILRYYILSEYGGVYADTDFECLMPFEGLRFLDFFTGIGYPSKIELYPGLIGCIPHHPILEQIITDIKEMKSIPETPNGVLEAISSYFFTREFWKVVTGYTENIAALPPDYFYPFPNQRGHQKRDGKKYIKDCSYALHHWCVSWLK